MYLYFPAAMQTQPKLWAFIDLAKSSQGRQQLCRRPAQGYYECQEASWHKQGA
ncbi:hypothetical protein [Enterovirga rhinocerotis]|uniref:hypothetical protein n=1 Tax=Enterovirga rhinocerotis TaxID=1339210 RepID=UPI001414D102|nr:hypothetical protein [Enterovirga rhinocerotis]